MEDFRIRYWWFKMSLYFIYKHKKYLILFTVWLRNRLVFAGLEPVISHTKKSCIKSYYRQFFIFLSAQAVYNTMHNKLLQKKRTMASLFFKSLSAKSKIKSCLFEGTFYFLKYSHIRSELDISYCMCNHYRGTQYSIYT